MFVPPTDQTLQAACACVHIIVTCRLTYLLVRRQSADALPIPHQDIGDIFIHFQFCSWRYLSKQNHFVPKFVWKGLDNIYSPYSPSSWSPRQYHLESTARVTRECIDRMTVSFQMTNCDKIAKFNCMLWNYTGECPFCCLYTNDSLGLAALYFSCHADLTDITVLSGLYPNQNPWKTGN